MAGLVQWWLYGLPEREDVHGLGEGRSSVGRRRVIHEPLWSNVAGPPSRGVKEEGVVCRVVLCAERMVVYLQK